MQKHVYLKEVTDAEHKKVTAYTTLTGLLKSEGLEKIENSVRNVLSKGLFFAYKKTIIRKVELVHGTKHTEQTKLNRSLMLKSRIHGKRN